MSSGLFILMYDNESLENSIKYGIYGFLMPPLFQDKPSPRSKHYAILSDYACCEKGTEIFFFTDRKITYGGKISESNQESPVFYLNGPTSPLGRKAKSKRYVNMDIRYDNNENGQTLTETEGVYNFGKNQRGEIIEKTSPFIIEFEKNEYTGFQISSDELYFKLGDYNYPFPSNTIQDKGACTLTPKETEILLELIKESNMKLTTEKTPNNTIINNADKTIFRNQFIINEKPINESHLEFILLAKKSKIKEIVKKTTNITLKKYTECRQVPLCPFKPMQFDSADICLYDLTNPIADKTLPNIIIELKHGKANFRAYEQVTKYLRWIKQCTPKEFNKVNAIIIAPDFTKNINEKTLSKNNISLDYINKIKLYSLKEDKEIIIE